MADIEPWLEEYIQNTRRLFGIGDVSREGHTELNIRYRVAKIELNQAMEAEGLRHTAMHELLHVALAPVELAQLRVTELLPEELRSHAEELFADGTEQAVEVLTRALQRSIKPS